MNKNWTGPARELITAVAAWVAAMNFAPDTVADQVGGIAIALVMVIAGVTNNEGSEQVKTLVRKFFSLIPALAVSLGVLSEATASQILLAVGPVISLIWSGLFKNPEGNFNGGAPVLIAIFAAMPFGLMSCQSTGNFQETLTAISESPTGQLLITQGGALLVAEVVEDKPEIAPILLAFADSQEGLPVDFSTFDEPLVGLGVQLLGTLSTQYSDDLTASLLASALRTGVAIGLGPDVPGPVVIESGGSLGSK